MAYLYVTEQGAKICNSNGKFTVEKNGINMTSIPEKKIESLMVYGGVQITTQAMHRCLAEGINVSFLNMNGSEYGKLVKMNDNAIRLRKQVYISDNKKQTLKFAKKIIDAKINNQLTILRRYSGDEYKISKEYEKGISDILKYKKLVSRAFSKESILGYEGSVAKIYFKMLSEIINPDFKFEGRNRRPSLDPFNAMLNFGYYLLYNVIYTALTDRKLSPSIGFLHCEEENNPAMISDMIEEWRAVLVDSTVLSMLKGNELSIEDFEKNKETGECRMKRTTISEFINKLEKKMRTKNNYLDYLKEEVDFREAIWFQAASLAKCIDEGDLEKYTPIKLR